MKEFETPSTSRAKKLKNYILKNNKEQDKYEQFCELFCVCIIKENKDEII